MWVVSRCVRETLVGFVLVLNPFPTLPTFAIEEPMVAHLNGPSFPTICPSCKMHLSVVNISIVRCDNTECGKTWRIKEWGIKEVTKFYKRKKDDGGAIPHEEAH